MMMTDDMKQVPAFQPYHRCRQGNKYRTRYGRAIRCPN